VTEGVPGAVLVAMVARGAEVDSGTVQAVPPNSKYWGAVAAGTGLIVVHT